MRIGVQCYRNVGMAKSLLDDLGAYSCLNQRCGVAVPIHYNKDKSENP